MSSDFRAYLRRLVRKGRLEVETADGVTETFGDGEGPLLGVKVVDRRAEWRLMVNPALALGELYMDGRLLVTRGDLYSVLDLGARNLLDLRGLPWVQALHETRVAFRSLHQRNDRRRAKRNIASHYDLDARLYDLFLDSDRQYSCAYFEYPGQSLDDAQTAKKRHIAAKLLPKDGATALDIGCGFGGMASLSRRGRRSKGHRRHAVGGAIRGRGEPRPRRRAGRPGRVPAAGLSRRAGDLRPHRFGWHVRACRRQSL